MRRVSVYNLQSSMKLAKAIYDSNGNMLLGAGVELKSHYILNLRKLGIPAVYIEDKWMQGVVAEDVVLEQTRIRAIQEVKALMSVTEKGEKQKTSFLSICEKVSSAVNNIVDELLTNPEIIVNLTDIRAADNYTFAHSVNVAVLSVFTGIAMGYKRKKLQKLGMGAIIHDLGKTKISHSILNKKGTLTSSEFNEIKKHPLYGYETTREQNKIAAESCQVIYQHHERNDGSGYPSGLRGTEISDMAKVVAVADVYDALVADRSYRNAFLPHKALEMVHAAPEKYDIEVMRTFSKHVAAYPVGTYVQLSSAETGVVIKNTVGFPMRPLVRIVFKDGMPVKEPYEIDLVQQLDVVISSVIDEQDFNAQSFQLAK